MIPSSTNKVTYNGNGVTSVFAYSFLIQNEDEILVQKYVTATGVLTTLIKTTDYTVSNAGIEAGGDITLVDPATDAPTGSKIILSLNPSFTQETNYTEYDTFSALSHESALDHIVQLCKYLKNQVDLALKMSNGLTGFNTSFSGVPTAGALPIVNATADGFELGTLSSVSGYTFPAGTGFLYQSALNTAVLGSFSGTANEITVAGSSAIVVSLPTSLTFTGKTVTGGTFSSVTLSSPALSGTITGNPTFSGTPSFGAVTLTGALTSSGGSMSGTFAGNHTYSGNITIGGSLTCSSSLSAASISFNGGGSLGGTFTSNPTFSGTVTHSGALIMSSNKIDEAQSSNIASASTTSIGSAATGNYINITGTTTITSFGTNTAGMRRVLKFAGALTLTHNASSLILPTGANITTAAGDCATFIGEGSSNWRCVNYMRADGRPNTGIVLAVQTFTASGTYTPTSGMRYCDILCVGGGAGGGGAAGSSGQSGAGSGGGGGLFAKKIASAATIGASQTVTIGAGGNGGAAGNNNGSNGSDTSVGSICVAKGGSGGQGGASTAGAAATLAVGAGGAISGSTGDYFFGGHPGTMGLVISGAGGQVTGGNGGGTGSGVNPITGTPVNGVANSGGGGSGGVGFNGTASAGGNGGSGFVTIIEYL